MAVHFRNLPTKSGTESLKENITKIRRKKQMCVKEIGRIRLMEEKDVKQVEMCIRDKYKAVAEKRLPSFFGK